MKRWMAAWMVFAVACTGGGGTTSVTASPPLSASPSTIPSTGQPEAMDGATFIKALALTAEEVRIEDETIDAIFGSDASSVCVDGETLWVLEFGSTSASKPAAATIDRDDPSQVGGAVVEWVGPPTFWHHGTFMVLYLGTDESAIQHVTDIVGDPIVRGSGSRGSGTPAC